MPTLFISYKRGTDGIERLVEALRTAHYRAWFDKDDIHASKEWQKEIDTGIDQADAIIVGLTSDACASPYVKYEVDRARLQNKRIFPVKLKEFDDSVHLSMLDLASIQYIDFTSPENTWRKSFERLLSDLVHTGLRVTPHDRRKDRTSEGYTLHQRYLKNVVDEVGRVNLAQVIPDESRNVYLEQQVKTKIRMN